MAGTAELKTAIIETEGWIDEFMQLLNWRNRDRAYAAFIAALHAARDCVPWDEAAQIGAYLPPLLRGLYFEGWRPTARSLPLTDRDLFLERIHEALHRDPGTDPELVARAVFSLLARRLPASELEDVRAVTPKGLHAFWPA
jgi:uncharacterized protein (DUF2267 family)